MTYTPKEGSGALFKNDKATSEKAPAYKGNFVLNGHQFEIAAWVREDRNGKKFFSLKVGEPRTTDKPVMDRAEQERHPERRPMSPDDEIPF